MMRFTIFLVLCIVLISFRAPAAEVTQSLNLYGGNPEELNRWIPNHLEHNPECAPFIASTLSLLEKYSGERHSGSSTRQTLTDLSVLINKTIPSQQPSCVVSAKSAYIAGAVYLLNDPYFESRAFPNRYPKVGLTLITARLANKGKLHFATDIDDREVRGLFDCRNSEIRINLTLRPYDDGTFMIHEIDHLFRDKYAPTNYIETLFPKDPALGINWKAFILADELLAVAHSVYFQQALKAGGLTRRNIGEIMSSNRGDISQLRKHGPLDMLWSLTKTPEIYSRYQIGDTTYTSDRAPRLDVFARSSEIFFESTLLRKQAKFQCDKDCSKLIHEQIEILAKRLWTFYFPNQEFDPDILRFLEPGNHDFRLIPLMEWLGQNDLQSEDDWASLWRVKIQDIIDKRRSSSNRVNQLLDALDQFEIDLNQVTNLCEDFENAAGATDLSKYRGRTILMSNPQKPGGVKPGGVKPGGVKPGGVKPCIDLH
jgi:hypothetical protein